MADILVHSKNKIVLIAGRYHVNEIAEFLYIYNGL